MAWNGSTRRGRLPADWPRIRQRVLDRDGWRCQIAGPGCTVGATDVDHINPGDDHSYPNLRAACRTCHQTKSSAEGGHAAAVRRGTKKRPAERHPGLI